LHVGDRPASGALHLNGAPHRIGSRSKGRLDSIAQPLQLLTAGHRNRFAHRLVMGAKRKLGSLVASALQVFSRTDQVSEEECDRSRPHHWPYLPTVEARAIRYHK
jgi:hypothetical protein